MLKVLKSQDLNYVKIQHDKEKKKLERLKQELNFLGVSSVVGDEDDREDDHDNDDDDDDQDAKTATSSSRPRPRPHPPKHTIFVQTKRQLDTFDPARHFQTLPSLVHRAYNRPRLDQLLEPIFQAGASGSAGGSSASGSTSGTKDAKGATEDMEKDSDHDEHEKKQRRKLVEKQRKQNLGRYKELRARMARQQQLAKAEQELHIQKLLATQKGRRYKVGKDTNGNPVYKWRQERKK